MMKNSDGSLISINDHTFVKFYYSKKFYSTKNASHLKVIINFKLQTKSSHDNNTPDIIDKIKLFYSDKSEIIIKNKDIFYADDYDITAYIDILSENFNINEITIINHFSGEIKTKFWIIIILKYYNIFKKQIKALNELLLFTRPDLL